MIEVRFFEPDAATREEWAAVHVFRRARNEEETPDEVLFDDEEFEGQARHRWPLNENRRWFAWAGGEIAGVVGASFRREGTPDYDTHAPHLFAWCGVREHRRRQGVATDLLRSLLDLMSKRGKALATFETSTPAGDAFLTAIGATLKHRATESQAPFDGLDWDLLAGWQAAAVPAASPLRWEVHGRRVPRDRVEALLPQYNALMADMPSGDLDEPPPRSELPVWLDWYEELDRHGGDHMLVMLMDGDVLAAVSEAVWDARFPDRLYQRLTGVARPWRGRGLGKGVKAALMRLVRERRPGVELVTTSNADVNAAMLSINRRLGLREHRRASVYQVGPAAIAAYLSRRSASARAGQADFGSG